MINFWKEDFKYYLRTPSYFDEGKINIDEYYYHFKVRGESANYLINRYGLRLPNIRVSIDSYEPIGTCGADSDNGLRGETADLYSDDLEELQTLLKDIMDIDKRNYEEYICNSDYYKKDSRWK